MKVWFVFVQVRIRVSQCFFLCILYMYNHLSGEDVFQSVIQAAHKKFKYSPNRSRTYEVLVTGPDTLPLSHRRLVGAKVSKLGSCDILYTTRTIALVSHTASEVTQSG